MEIENRKLFHIAGNCNGYCKQNLAIFICPFHCANETLLLIKDFSWLLSFLPVQKLASTTWLYCMF